MMSESGDVVDVLVKDDETIDLEIVNMIEVAGLLVDL